MRALDTLQLSGVALDEALEEAPDDTEGTDDYHVQSLEEALVVTLEE